MVGAPSESDATSYYSESDPFDCLYSTVTKYSDPIDDAVDKVNWNSSTSSK